MNQEQHLLVTLSEELNELIFEALSAQKAVSKALRFGLDDTWRDNEYSDSPRNLIYKELNDLIGVAELLAERGTLPREVFDRALIEAKKAKVIGFGFEYAREQGTLIG